MPALFRDPLHDAFGTWPLGYIPYGGADFGEVAAVAAAVGDGDDGAFHAAWTSAAQRMAAQADDALARGHRAAARESLLRAACFFGASYHPLYGEPVDPRLVEAFRAQYSAFERAMALGEPAVTPLSIPYEGAAMPAYLVPAEGREKEVRPLLILNNGYDGTITDLYFASAVAASRRGYHCLIFDGPGQGAMLIEHGLRLRHDWEVVVRAVVDFALTLANVDPGRIALSGWSLGGYLAPRAASYEHRLAACIADPGQPGIAPGLRQFAIKLGVPPEAAGNLDALDDAAVARMAAVIHDDRRLRWSIEQRGFWMHGVNDLRGYLRAAQAFDMGARIAEIRCPTLITVAENDVLASGAPGFHDALTCRKALVRFTADEGAGDHCEMVNRSLLNRRVLDWLDDVLA